MIIISSGLFLSPTLTQPLTHTRIGYQTYTRGATPAQVQASSTAVGAVADAPLRPDTVEYWEPQSLPATWRFDMGELRDVDYLGIAGHTIGSARCSVRVETSADGESWQALAGDLLPADNSALMFLDESRPARYVQMTLEGEQPPRVAVVYVGVALAMPRPIYGGHTPITLSRETVLHHSLSRGGQFLGQGYRRLGLTGSIAFRHLPASWYRAQFDPFVRAARRYPYFVAWRPATFPAEVAYVWTDRDIAPSNMGIRDLMDVSWNMKGLGNA